MLTRISGGRVVDPTADRDSVGDVWIEEGRVVAPSDRAPDRTIDATREDFASVRTGRANPGLYSKVMVDYYGAMTPLQQLASFTVPEPRVILISPFDQGAMTNIEKAIRDSDLGVNPSNDGQIIRVVFPQLSEERRKDMVKVARSKGEDAKVSIRSVRRTAMHELQRIVKDGEAGEDEVTRAEKELESLTKRHVEAVDQVLAHKESELLEV